MHVATTTSNTRSNRRRVSTVVATSASMASASNGPAGCAANAARTSPCASATKLRDRPQHGHATPNHARGDAQIEHAVGAHDHCEPPPSLAIRKMKKKATSMMPSTMPAVA
jgi:hypothetical protein